MALRLFRLLGFLTRRQGRLAVALLALSIRGWLSDRGDDDARGALVTQLRTWSRRVGGRGGRAADALARDVERWKPSPGAWEKEVLALRNERPEIAPGPVRAAAIDAYLAQLAAAEGVVRRSRDPGRARRRALAVLDGEEAALAGERALSDAEGQKIRRALERAKAACYRESAPIVQQEGDGPSMRAVS